MLRSYSVIVPVLNKHNEIVRTLQSVADSMSFLDENHPEADRIRGDVIVVDEGSTDGTTDLVQEFARTHSRLRMIQHRRSYGIGPARNTGVRMSDGEVLFFCDGDDLFFREHLYVGFSILDRSANVEGSMPENFLLRAGNRGHVVFPARRPVAALRTGVYVKDSIHPHWQAAIDRTLAQNLCVRRECHEWGEGFPEEAFYKSLGGCEDGAYNSWLNTFFHVGRIELKTVEYIRYPGNSFDRQIKRFQHPPGSEFDAPTPEQQTVLNIPMQRQEQKIQYLLDKWLLLRRPALPDVLLNWAGVVRELVGRRQMPEAIRVAAEAAQRGQELPGELLEEIRRARGQSSIL